MTHPQLTLTSDRPLTLEASEGEEPRRTLFGQAVPYGVTARVSGGQLVRFAPGSVNLTGTPVVRDHDATRPVGIVAQGDDSDQGHQVRVSLSATPGGDESLTLAADGVLRGFSVGIDPTEYEWDSTGDEPVMVVAAGSARELSLLINPAYGEASAVTKVAASEPQPEEPDMTTDTATTVAQDDVVDAAADAGPVDIAAAAPVAAVVKSEPVQLDAGQFIVETILAQRGDRQAQATIQAALAGNVTDDNAGVVPPQYLAGIIGGLAPYRPAYASVTHAGLPAKGDSLVRPKWDTLPVVEKYPTQGGQPPTGAVSIGNVSVDKDSWAHAVTASLALINRSDPSYATEYFTQAVLSFYGALDADITAALVAAGGSAVTGETPQTAIAAAVKACVSAQVDASGIFRGYWPTWAMVGMDVWEALVGTTVLEGPAFGGGSVQLDSPNGSLSGLTVRGNPALDADGILVGTPAAATVYEGASMQLRALVVNTMSMELGFMQDTAVHVAYTDAIAAGQLAAAPPVAASRRSKD